MVFTNDKKVEFLVVDTTAFIQNAQLLNVAEKILTVEDVVSEITNKRQLRRLCTIPYELEVANVDPESIKVVTEFAKKTGDYPCLSATDIKVMALTYELEKQHVGTEHLRVQPVAPKSVNVITAPTVPEVTADVTGFYVPGKKGADKVRNHSESNASEEANKDEDVTAALQEKFETLNCDVEDDVNLDDVMAPVKEDDDSYSSEESNSSFEDDEDSWITPSNVALAKKQVNSELMEEKHVKVACMTTDFAMQNVLKQMNLNVAALDGRMIRQLRTYILRCYTCFGTTSVMTKTFCPKCGNNTLKRVAVSLDEHGKQQIHINGRKPLTGRGKRFSLPTIKGGKHSNNPRLFEDQPMPDQKPTRLARTKTNALDDDYVAGFSPFVMRDVNSKSAQLCIRPGAEVKHWMKKNPNEARRRRK